MLTLKALCAFFYLLLETTMKKDRECMHRLSRSLSIEKKIETIKLTDSNLPVSNFSWKENFYQHNCSFPVRTFQACQMGTFNFELRTNRNIRGTVISILNNQGNLRKKPQPKTKQKKLHQKKKKPEKALQTKAASTKENFASLSVLPTYLQPHSCSHIPHM